MNVKKYDLFVPGKHGEKEDRESLMAMEQEAREYFNSVGWNLTVAETRYGFGVGGVVAVFLMGGVRPGEESPDAPENYYWVVCGDLPSACFGVDGNDTWEQALDTYCVLMDDWAEAVLEGGELGEVYPVQAKPTTENAHMLLSRIRTIRSEIVDPMLE